MKNKLSHFDNSKNSSFPNKTVTLNYVIERIKTGEQNLNTRISNMRSFVEKNGDKKPKYSYLKEILPSFTVSGVFELRKKMSPIKTYSGLTILDVDSLIKQKVVLEKLKDKIIKIPGSSCLICEP